MKFLFLSMVIAFTALAQASIIKPLPKGDRLAQVAKAIGTQLADGNISTGTTALKAGELSVMGNLKSVLKKGFLEVVQYHTEANEAQLGEIAKDLKMTVSNFIDGDSKKGTVYKMTSALIESNDYNPDNKELRAESAAYLWAVLRQLPVDSGTLVGHVQARIWDSSSQQVRSVQYFLVVGASQKKAVQFFTIQGSM